MTKQELEKEHGEILTTSDLTKDYEVHSFLAPIVIVTRRYDGVRGSMQFQHQPRFYFSFKEILS